MEENMKKNFQDDKFDEIMKEVVRVCAKVEPDCRILL